MYLILKFPEYGKQIAYTIDFSSIQKNNLIGKFLSKLLAEFHEKTNITSIDTESLIETNEERKLLADIYTKELHIDDPVKLINECIRTLKKNTLNQKKTLLTQKIQQTDSNDVKFIELMKKVKQIDQELIETQNLAI